MAIEDDRLREANDQFSDLRDRDSGAGLLGLFSVLVVLLVGSWLLYSYNRSEGATTTASNTPIAGTMPDKAPGNTSPQPTTPKQP